MSAVPEGAKQPARGARAFALLAALQGACFLLTGVWPVLHMPSFLAVTGPKIDLWLVRTVGLVLAAEGLGLLVAALRREVSAGLAVMAAGSSLALLFIDVYYVLDRTIPPVYLLDALAEVVLLAGWLLVAIRFRHWKNSTQP